MGAPAAIVAAFGLGVAVYAAMETEIEDRTRRTGIGLCGLLIFAIGVMLV